jgi:hypothetical protein
VSGHTELLSPLQLTTILRKNGGEAGRKFELQSLSPFLRNVSRFWYVGDHVQLFALRKAGGGEAGIFLYPPIFPSKTTPYYHRSGSECNGSL